MISKLKLGTCENDAVRINPFGLKAFLRSSAKAERLSLQCNKNAFCDLIIRNESFLFNMCDKTTFSNSTPNQIRLVCYLSTSSSSSFVLQSKSIPSKCVSCRKSITDCTKFCRSCSWDPTLENSLIFVDLSKLIEAMTLRNGLDLFSESKLSKSSE